MKRRTGHRSRAYLDTASERNRIGARLGAKHQPQHIEKLAALRMFQQAGFAKLLRLVCDTTALRENSARI
jgi:hypothetical protein